MAAGSPSRSRTREMRTRTRCSASALSGPGAAGGAQDLLGAEAFARAAEQLDDQRLERAPSLERHLAVVDAQVMRERVDDERRPLGGLRHVAQPERA